MSRLYYSIVSVLLTILVLFVVACREIEESNEIRSTDTSIESNDSSITVKEEEPSSFDDVITMAIGEYPPYVSENLKEYGLIAHIVKRSYANVEIDVKYEFYPWARALVMAEFSDVVGTFPWSMNEERSKVFYISDTILPAQTCFMFLESNPNMPNDFRSANDLKEARITGVQGYAQIEVLEKLGLEFDISNNEEEAIAKIMKGRIDTFPTDPLVSMEIVKKKFPERIAEVKFLMSPLSKLELGILISKEHPKGEYFFKKFNEGYQQLLDSGEFKNILMEHEYETLIGE